MATAVKTAKKRFAKLRLILKIFAVIAAMIIAWMLIDLFGPWSTDLRKFDAAQMAHLETNMWRSYYDKKGARLYWQLFHMLHDQAGLTFWRANWNAYCAARAAMVFKVGHSRAEYQRALPYLEPYFNSLIVAGHLSADPKIAAQQELEWWIVHRERDKYGVPALEDALAKAAAIFYGVDAAQLREYAKARAAAMIERDDRAQAGNVSEADWQDIDAKLLTSYTSLAAALNH
jgi:hypothetical protein